MRDRSISISKLAKLSEHLCVDPRIQSASSDDDATSVTSPRYSSDQIIGSSPYHMSPSNASPYTKSPWIHSPAAVAPFPEKHTPGLLGSLVRKEGHVYSLATSGDLLYTGSESKNIRIWKRWREFSGFKSSSGFVKAIVIADGKIFTGHQDGKIRVWKVSNNNPAIHNRVGTLPRMKDFLKSSINPANYVQVRRHRSSVWLRHYDAVSCLSFNEESGLLYSGSWDKTVKVWRISDSRCLESITAHDDAINSVVAAPGGLVYTGSADGTVKMWRRELIGRRTHHVLVHKLLEQESAVTALAVSAGGSVLYAGSSDGIVNWWRCGAEMVHAGVLRGHEMAVLCLAAAGSLVISGSADKTLCVWRREDGGVHTRLSVLAGHGGPIKCLAVEEDRCNGGGDDGWIVYSGSLDRSVRVWRVAERPEEQETESPWPMQSPLHVRSAPGVEMESDAVEAKLGYVAERRVSFGDQC